MWIFCILEFLGICIYGFEREYWKEYGCVNEEGLLNVIEMKNLFVCCIKEIVFRRYGLIFKVRMLEMIEFFIYFVVLVKVLKK